MKNFHKYFSFVVWVLLQVEEGISITAKNSSGDEVDNFINNYMEEVRRTLRIGKDQHVIQKRSQPDIDLKKLTGLELLVGFQEMYSVPARFPLDLILFSHCQPNQNKMFSAALLSRPEDNLDIHVELVLYKYEGGKWRNVDLRSAAGGRSIAVEHVGESVFLVVSQYIADEGIGSTVWRLPSDSDKLQYVHMLRTQFASHAITWSDADTFYAAVAVSENAVGSQKRFSTLSPVYRWLGNSFDKIDELPTNNPQALAQFNIRSSIFVAVANFQNDLGETVVDSDIFRYDLTSGKFNVYQKLPTEAAVDIKYFCFQSNEITESFLIYASAFHTDEIGNKDYSAPSVVYKLSDEEYFVPFQALRVTKVTSWLPVQHAKDGWESLTLIGISEEGIISFQYDGWRFVSTGLQHDTSTFGPGHKTLNVFYFNNEPHISVANRDSKDDDTNVFSPVYKYNPRIENLQEIIAKWVDEMVQQMFEIEAKLNELTTTVQNSPSVNDSEIQLGSFADFKNAEIHQLKTFVTKVGGSDPDAKVYADLDQWKIQLDHLNQTLAELPFRIDQTSIHTYTVYEDISLDSLDVTCQSASNNSKNTCLVQDLEVINMNSENLQDFLENTINIEKPIEFQEEITFNELALRCPLNTKMVNGHKTETLIDWTKEVNIDHKLEVEGDVFAKNSISVSGAIDGVLLNVERREDIFESAGIIESLTTSQLMLSDGKLSNVDFSKFVSSTLKTHGDQVFSESQDVDRIEAEEVTAVVYKAVPPPSHHPQQRRSCQDEDCTEDGTVLHVDTVPDGIVARARAGDVESIALLGDELIIPRNITLFGTLIVENGILKAKDLVDLKFNVSAVNMSKSALPLNQSVIDKHFKFVGELTAPILNIDTLNSVPLTSLVNLEEEDNVRLTGRKIFKGSLTLDGTVHMTGSVNGRILKRVKENNEDLVEIDLDYLHAEGINSENIKLGENYWYKQSTLKGNDSIIFKTLLVEEDATAKVVMVRGSINNYTLEKLLNDTVFEGDDNLLITGTKRFIGETEIRHLYINDSETMNYHFVTSESLWKKRLMEAEIIEVDNLFYEGKLDGLSSAEFGKWLLTEGDQMLAFPNSIHYMEARDVIMPADATLNSINITHLLTEAVSVHDNATFDSVIFEGHVNISELVVGGKMNGLEVPADIVILDPTVDQLITGHKRVRGNVFVGCDFHVFGLMSNINVSHFCQVIKSNESNLVISGDGIFKEEPTVLESVNNKEWRDVIHNIWFKEDNVTILDSLLMNEVEFENLYVRQINNNNVDEQLNRLVRLSEDQEINGTFYFHDVLVEKGLIAESASVGGEVQGLKLSSFIKNVLLNGVDQEIKAVLDFSSIVIEKEFTIEGLLNGLNISSDLMLMNVAANTMTAELTLVGLSAARLQLPAGATVAGVDVAAWRRTAITKSGNNNVISGNVRFTGQLDSSQGIRVKKLVNGLTFDQHHILLSSGPQEVTGKKTFSSESDLKINKLKVEGLFNNLNVTEFYDNQLTASADVRIVSHKKFTAPLWSKKVLLPEIYQNHNLTWLESELSAPLPWPSYHGQLTQIQHSRDLALRCLDGKAYFLENVTRVGDVEGDVLFTLPLKSGNTSALGAVRENSDKGITLSLLHWSDQQSMFLHTPDSVDYFLRVVPSAVQTITLPGGELAAYVTSYLPHNNQTSSEGHGDLFRLRDGRLTQTMVRGGKPGSTLLSYLDYNAMTCFVVVAERCTVYCQVENRIKIRSFSCKNITKAALFTTDRGPYVVGVQGRPQGSLFLWRVSARRISLVLQSPQFNPVSIAATTTHGPHIAVANLHIVGHSRPETVDIYRFDEDTSRLLVRQSLPAVAPSQVVFSSLPTAESLLYVASVVPAAPLRVYIYRGLQGYRPLAADPTLPSPSDLQPFSDHDGRHFLIIPSGRSAAVLRAGFTRG